MRNEDRHPGTSRRDFLTKCIGGGLIAIPAIGEGANMKPTSNTREKTEGLSNSDWLLDSKAYRADIKVTSDSVTLENGLILRVMKLSPNAATIEFRNLVTGEEMLRSVRPEASVTMDHAYYDVGGLIGQPIHNYLDPSWLKSMTANPDSFQFVSAKVGKTKERFPWKKRLEWMPADLPWPPSGKSVTLTFHAPANSPHAAIVLEVHYEIYDGAPLLSKWIVVRNNGDKPIMLNRFACEILAAVEPESIVDTEGSRGGFLIDDKDIQPTATSMSKTRWNAPNMLVETDYTFGGSSIYIHSGGAHWESDPLYSTQVNYNRETPCLLECKPPLGPNRPVVPGEEFKSFHVFELLYDSTDRERRGLATRRMYRMMAPWVTENPIYMHVLSAEPDAVRLAVDQCAQVGFEMVIMTFGSGFDFENRDEQYQMKYKELAEYARSKGIALGGYSLLASRSAANPADNTQGEPAKFGVMPCLGAQWGVDYLNQLKHFIGFAGLGVLENDGSYPGDMCAATYHPYHSGLDDSQWVMWKAITNLYEWCRSQGVYLNIPDWYFMNGASKTGMGYRETNWSLPRAYQEIIERQNIYDGTWEMTPSMGWMFVPLTQYQGGGAAATIEPLKEHLAYYGRRMANLFGSGVQACYRGPRLYDAPETERMVRMWVDFYKRHRAILNSDIIHLRRPDGRTLDYLLHANPTLKEKGLLMVYNPLPETVTEKLTIPLYYTGLSKTARVSERDGRYRTRNLNANLTMELIVTVPPEGNTWFVFE